MAKYCRRQMKCNIEGCISDHNRLLHKLKTVNLAFSTAAGNRQKNRENSHAAAANPGSMGSMTNSQTGNYMVQGKNVSLRTIPVIAKKSDKILNINVLLDDGSSQSYVNIDVANELGLNGPTEEVVVEIIHGKTTKFTTENVSFDLSPLNV